MAEHDYIAVNKRNWDERAPEHAKSPDYAYKALIAQPTLLSDVVTFDIPLLGSIENLAIVHLQCHIGTDTLSLARRGAKSVTGLDFSPASLAEARRLAAATQGSGGEKLTFVEAPIYEALTVLPEGGFDLVFTGIGALCWIPSIARWAGVVHSLLKPGGRLFIREGHPVLWAMDERVTSALQIGFPYFEREEPMLFDDGTTYVAVEEGKVFEASKAVEWNHGLGAIVQALLDVGMLVTGLVEHQSVPWEALPGQMVKLENGEFELKEDKDRLPLTYTLQAVKKG
ncbi:methyltransferase domain protein [Neohortaea acidophila]|uniref:Methyltransferase domain protein n=1 Tax=Neohortaea acidophila TaxID=245834 RepID=A0A6A6PMD3_9PEZI|nr:methyltransferase domain protein [Neohortaea acidophila]KAF2480417.1 methyltransferase domain protein [Neohortaea acidophila]